MNTLNENKLFTEYLPFRKHNLKQQLNLTADFRENRITCHISVDLNAYLTVVNGQVGMQISKTKG